MNIAILLTAAAINLVSSILAIRTVYVYRKKIKKELRSMRIIASLKTPPTIDAHPDNDNFDCGWETFHSVLTTRIKGY